MRPYLLGGAAVGGLLTAMILVTDAVPSSASPIVEDRPTESTRFSHGGSEVEVTFRGEVGHDEIFAPGETLTGGGGLVVPRDAEGEAVGDLAEARPTWLSFSYRIDGFEREVLIAKQPVMNDVSWDAIARAGAALGDGEPVRFAGEEHRQDATIDGASGHRYRVRLPSCGQSTSAPLSEWNLLVGAVHAGDRDFSGERYGWITDPYEDEDLVVGYQGSLNWCRDVWRESTGMRVVRGYFKVSRFHATASDFAGGRVYWRPVLERLDPERPAPAPMPGALAEGVRPQVSPDRKVRYFGAVQNDALLGKGVRIDDLVGLHEGEPVGDGVPHWLLFQYEGKALFVASRAIRRSLAWDDIAKAGAALGDGSAVSVNSSSYAQDAEIGDAHGNRYRVRLLRCGRSTLDRRSEYNRLIGGIHRGDGDFVASPDGIYGWVRRPLADEAVGIVAGYGGASWCKDTEQMHGERHAVNRGYLTVARYHLTESDFPGSGFGWRPVLELID